MLERNLPLTALIRISLAGLLLGLAACGGGGASSGAGAGGGGSAPANTAPTAVITQVGTAEVGQTLSFDGSQSRDPEGDALRYTWALVSAPPNSKATLDGLDKAQIRLVPDLGGVYELTLVVNDGKLDSATARQRVTVSSKNRPPLPYYRYNTPLIPGESMQLDASGSRDPDGDTLRFKWTVLNTPPDATASFSDASGSKTELIAQKGGSYQIRLEVSDAESTAALAFTVPVTHRPIPHIAGPATAVPGQEAVLDASGSTDPDGDPLTFVWELQSRPNGSRAELSSSTSSRVRFTPDLGGAYVASMVVYDPHTSSRSNKLAVVIVNHPPVAQITAPATGRMNSTVLLDGGKSSDMEQKPLSYAWNLVSKPAGSQARFDNAGIAQPRLQVDLGGIYTVSLVVNDGRSDSAAATASITVASGGNMPSAPRVTMTPHPALPGQDIQFSASAADPQGLPLSFRWQFSDGTTATGASVSRRFASAGGQAVSVVAINSQGLVSESASVTARVVGQVLSSLPPACMGPTCGAVGVNRYSGTGTGIWSQTNTTGDDQAFNLDIDNVAPGRAVLLLIANGSASTAPSLPDFGQAPAALPIGASASPSLRRAQAAPTGASPVSPLARHDEAHARIQRHNDSLLKAYAQSAAPLRKALNARSLTAGSAGVPPALQSRRIWQGGARESAPYDTSAEAVCALPGGRHAVFWVDSTALTKGLVDAAAVSEFANFYCGNSGAYARLLALNGESWGNHGDERLIADDPLQDIHIVLGDPKGDVFWGGYYNFANSYRKSHQANSNEALAFFLNMRLLSTQRYFLLSTLVHETQHLINAYQRTVRRGVTHESWLEETTAMMSEDLVVPALLKDGQGQPYNDIGASRLPFLMWTGGGESYTAGPYGTTMFTYAHGGSFGAFVNRRYGMGLFQRLLHDCNDHSSTQTSYGCLDSSLRSLGSGGIGAELVQMAVSVMSPLAPAQSPPGFGFPLRLDGVYLMPALDPSARASQRPARSPELGSSFGATSFVYITDAVSAGATRYRRSGVIVPAGTSVTLVIR